ncbi:hypothetical protein Vretimale_19224, partial [Volvox reticuliferus]
GVVRKGRLFSSGICGRPAAPGVQVRPQAATAFCVCNLQVKALEAFVAKRFYRAQRLGQGYERLGHLVRTELQIHIEEQDEAGMARNRCAEINSTITPITVLEDCSGKESHDRGHQHHKLRYMSEPATAVVRESSESDFM